MAGTVVALLLTAGCASTTSGTTATAPHPSHSGTGGTEPKPIDAPIGFLLNGPQVPVDMLTDTRDSAHDNRPAVALVGTTAYVEEPKDLLVVDTTSGKPISKIAEPITSQSLVDQPVTNTAPPIVVDADGSQLVLSVWTASPAAGPTLEVAAVDTTTHALAWSWSAPLAADNAHPLHLQILDGKGVALVGAQTQLGGGVTYAIDLSTHRTRWSNEHFIPMAVSGGTLVGDSLSLQDQHHQLTGLDPATGTPRWRGLDAYDVDVEPAGPSLVVATQKPYDSNASNDGPATGAVLDAATGRVVTALTSGLLPAGTTFSCDYDQRATSVCIFSAPGTLGPQTGAIGVDAATGKIIWNTTDDFPVVNLVWHGHVYGTLHDNPVLWDATTGKPAAQVISVAPSVVNGFVGLEMAQQSGGLLTETAGLLKVHRAVS